ncbi:MAG: hypothetical protein RLY93_15785 [Sumerlaeia bacterium]
MPFAPKPAHLLTILLRRRDRAAAEGLFLEGSAEYEAGNLADARSMFLFGSLLDRTLAGNHFNYAVTVEKMEGEGRASLKAWRRYLKAANADPKQTEENKAVARGRVAAIAQRLTQ